MRSWDERDKEWFGRELGEREEGKRGSGEVRGGVAEVEAIAWHATEKRAVCRRSRPFARRHLPPRSGRLSASYQNVRAPIESPLPLR